MKRYQIKRFQLLWILFLFAFQFSKATNCTCPNNVVQNPSFENGITNWTYFNGNFSANTYAAQCSTYAGHFQHTSGNGGFYQDLTNVAVGSKLTISFYGGVHDNSFNQRFGLFYLNSAGVQIGGDSVNVDGPLPNMSFYTIISTVPSGTTKVRIMGKASGNWLKVDQICLNVEQPCVNFTALAQSDLNLVKTRSWTNQIVTAQLMQ